MFTSYRDETAVALEALQLAMGLSQRIQLEMASMALSKGDQSPVTAADFASQAVVARLLDRAFPKDPLVAEENSELLRGAASEELLTMLMAHVASIFPEATPERICEWIDHGAGEPAARFWTLDPIDGTKGFLRGDQYVVALALIERGKVILGCMGCPSLSFHSLPGAGDAGVILMAVRGQGSWVFVPGGEQTKQLSVSSCRRNKCARILCSYESTHTDPKMLISLKTKLDIKEPFIRMDSQAKYALLASGAGELIFRLPSPSRSGYDERIWDHAAGSLIVEEAGGLVTDLRGNALDFGAGRMLTRNLGILASNGLLHERALAAIRSLGADRRERAS